VYHRKAPRYNGLRNGDRTMGVRGKWGKDIVRGNGEKGKRVNGKPRSKWQGFANRHEPSKEPVASGGQKK
jgi:hypothetical protein